MSISEHIMKDSLDLSRFTLSRTTGFIPSVLPSSRLPRYYDAWEDLCANLPTKIKQGTIRQHVKRLKVLNTAHLDDENDWRRAYSILSYLVSAYIWTGDTPASIVPSALAEPLLIVCKHVEVPPVITYTALILWNTKLVTGADSDFDIDNLDVCRSFTGTPDERWFHMICAAMEATAGPAIEQLAAASGAVAAGNFESVIDTLELVKYTIQHLTTLLHELNKRVDPTIWYEQLRPYLAGGIDDRLAKGISFDNGKTYLTLAGANAGQSSLFQFFDAALSIEHTSDFAARMREYMPGSHARCLQAIEDSASVRQLVLDNGENGELQQAYNGCLRELELFRSKHIQIVSRYIVIPAREAARRKASSSLCQEVVKLKKELRGVGGAPLMPFLRGMRDETRESVVCQMQP